MLPAGCFAAAGGGCSQTGQRLPSNAERGEIVTRRVAFALLVFALALGLFGPLQGKSRAPETEIVLLYHSDTKGEIEECG
jgi:hypothetical protein